MYISGLFVVFARGDFQYEAGTGAFLGLFLATCDGPYAFKNGTLGVIFFFLWGAFKGGRERVGVLIAYFFRAAIGIDLGVFPSDVTMKTSGRAALCTQVIGRLDFFGSINMPFYGILVSTYSDFGRFFIIYRCVPSMGWGFACFLACFLRFRGTRCATIVACVALLLCAGSFVFRPF